MHRAMQLVIDHIDCKDKHLVIQNKWKKVIKICVYQKENNKTKINQIYDSNFYWYF